MEIIDENPKNTGFNPTAGESFGTAWKLLWNHFPVLLAIVIIYSLLSGPVSIFQYRYEHMNNIFFPGVFVILFSVFITGPIGYSTSWVFLKAARGESYEIRDMFAVFERNYWNAVAANLVVGLIVVVGIFLLIVPGIIFAIRLAFVPYLIMDRKMELGEALDASWQMTKGYGGEIFLMGILAVLVVILGFIALFVGVIISMIWIYLAVAIMYQAVSEAKGQNLKV